MTNVTMLCNRSLSVEFDMLCLCTINTCLLSWSINWMQFCAKHANGSLQENSTIFMKLPKLCSVICLSVICRLSVCLLQSWIVTKRCEIDPWLLWDTIGKSISGYQNPQTNLTLDDLEEVISRSQKWKWPRSSKRLLLGPGCLWTKMFPIAQLIKVHLDLWPWLTFRGHFKVKNVKVAYIFLMVRD